jgi:hypothetical protein
MARSGRRRESSRVGYRCSLPGTARAHRRAARPPRPTPRTTNRRRVRRRARRSTPSQSPARSSIVDDPEVRLCRPGGSHERDASDRSDLKRRGRRPATIARKLAAIAVYHARWTTRRRPPMTSCGRSCAAPAANWAWPSRRRAHSKRSGKTAGSRAQKGSRLSKRDGFPPDLVPSRATPDRGPFCAPLLKSLDEAAFGKCERGDRVTFEQPFAGAGGRFRWFACHLGSLAPGAVARGANEFVRRSGDRCGWERLVTNDGPFIAFSATGSDDLILPGAWFRHPRLQVFSH